ACLMMRREIFTDIDGFDEDFPLDFNDVDLCLRIHQAGYRNVFTPYAELVHYESASHDRNFDPAHLDKLRQKFEGSEYMKNDPYYNPNLSTRRPFFETAMPFE
ncbi:MAG: glycosyl transferase family 2, partial [Phormidesmis sp.]